MILMPNRVYSVSNLTNIYIDTITSSNRLDMVQITSWDDLPSFQAVRDHVLNTLRYPSAQCDKLETYGWVPTLYEPNERTFRSRKTKCWCAPIPA